MINTFLYNTLIELYILICLILWIVMGCTIVIPFVWNAIEGGGYFRLNDWIKTTREGKLPYTNPFK